MEQRGSRKALTPRQAQILELLAEGLADKEIAARLGLSLATVRSHLQRMYREHGFRNRAGAAAGWVASAGQPSPPATTPPPNAVPLRRPHRSRVPAALAAAALTALVIAVLMLRPVILFQGGAHSDIAARLAAGSAQAPASSSASAATKAIAPSAQATPVNSRVGVGSPAQAAKTPLAPVPTVALPAAPRIQAQAASAQLGLINQDRAGSLLPPVQWNACLAGVASQVAKSLAQQGYLAPTGGLALDLGCRLGGATAENAGYWSSIDDAQLNSVFMSDPVQRSHILGPYHSVGAAWARGPNGIAFLVVEFA